MGTDVESLKTASIALSVFLSAVAVVRILYNPTKKLFLKLREKRIERAERLKRIDDTLGKVESHLEESIEIAKWQENVDKRLDEHAEAIADSKNERRVLWKAQRATLDGLRQLRANGMVTDAIRLMDEYADDNIR